jgi:ribosomal protein L11 methyltransferase
LELAASNSTGADGLAGLEALSVRRYGHRVTIKATLLAAFPEARRISNFLERDLRDHGVVVSLDERADGVWSVDAYFELGEPDEIAACVRDRLGSDAFRAPLTVEVLPETDWVAAGLSALPPVAAGRFVVHGSHDRGKIPAGRMAIEIDAGRAFGTGHHATTAGCLTVLDGLLRARRYGNPLDLGAGSGVLAIAMAKVLRKPVLAGDIDPLAVRIAAENARANRVAHLVRPVLSDGLAHAEMRGRAPFDLVVANILAEPLMRLAPALSRMLAPGGDLVLSGLLAHQRERVVAAYAAQGVHLRAARRFENWAVLHLRRPAGREPVRRPRAPAGRAGGAAWRTDR